jgi:hypothetical protein
MKKPKFFKEIVRGISFTREQYEAKTRGCGMVSFDAFINNIAVSCHENDGTIEDAVFIANDAYYKL